MENQEQLEQVITVFSFASIGNNPRIPEPVYTEFSFPPRGNNNPRIPEPNYTDFRIHVSGFRPFQGNEMEQVPLNRENESEEIIEFPLDLSTRNDQVPLNRENDQVPVDLSMRNEQVPLNRENGQENEQNQNEQVPLNEQNPIMENKLNTPGLIQVFEPIFPQYKTLDTRMESFELWPPAMNPTPRELAEAGFFYSLLGDRCNCFYCGLQLGFWTQEDNAWLEHEKYNDHCDFLKLNSDKLERARNLPKPELTAIPPPEEPEEKEINFVCKICLNEELRIAFMPCGHLVSCGSCCLCVEKCPICRAEIYGYCKIFLS